MDWHWTDKSRITREKSELRIKQVFWKESLPQEQRNTVTELKNITFKENKLLMLF